MSLAKRIIPCLDVRGGRTVKGVQFSNMQDFGDPVELALHYAQAQADELVFLDISATEERRKTLIPLVRRIAQAIDIPFTVGGGIAAEEDVYRLLEAGCDKISINSAAVAAPQLISKLAARFGSQCIVVALDVQWTGNRYEVMTHAGKRSSGLEACAWASEAENSGAGELLLTSINRDGTCEGFDLGITSLIAGAAGIPVIASGGAGCKEHFEEIFLKGKADAALAAGIFHRQQLSVPELKSFLRSKNIRMR